MSSGSEKNKQRKHISLTGRITLAFLAVIIVPVILMTVMLLQPLSTRLRAYGETYGVENLSYSGIMNNSMIIESMADREAASLSEAAAADPSVLSDKEFLDKFNADISGNHSFIVVRKAGRIFFNGSALADEEIADKLPEADTVPDDRSGDWMTIRSDMLSLVKSVDAEFADGDKGEIIIFTSMNQIWPGMARWLRDLVVTCILILVITSLVMGVWLYLTTINPLMQLKKGAQNIRDGNLDFELEKSGVQELDEVCEDFEEMRKRLKESAEEKVASDSGNKELIRNISHDLKTPLTAIRGYCEGILDGVADTPQKQEKYIRTIYNKANEMDRLINELAIYSRIDTNRIPYTFTKINAATFMDDCMDELEPEFESRDIKYTYTNEIAGTDTLIIGDAEQLTRVIHNIVSNSMKYMDKPEKKIDIRVLDKDDFIQVEFEDNGCGMANSDLPKIFDRFYRTDASRNSASGGSGIGLSIVKKILEDHGGSVWATSKEGEWTVMHFVLRKYVEARADE